MKKKKKNKRARSLDNRAKLINSQRKMRGAQIDSMLRGRRIKSKMSLFNSSKTKLLKLRLILHILKKI
jgi:hypothetical protein